MSVLIKGTELPKDHVRVLVLHPDGRAIDEWGNTYQASLLPPHGRLIDADELFKEMERKGWFDNADRDKVEDLVLAAPTILEAEEGE